MSIKVCCPQCSTWFSAETGRINKAKKIDAPIYCGKKCAGISRRLKTQPTEVERKASKKLYDARRRVEKADEIRSKKKEYFKRTYKPEKAAVKRKENMHKHVEYCRRPEYRAYKRDYDRKYLACKKFGEFSEVALLLQEIDREIEKRATRHEIYRINGTLNKAQMRRREL
jgi:hypothetical protein